MDRVEVKPALLQWARERAGVSTGALARRFPKLDAWERGELRPTLKQLERFAKATHTPVGFLFLDEPPVERVPIPDFRTVARARMERPSPDLSPQPSSERSPSRAVAFPTSLRAL